jgi:hypothetical protein
VRGTLAVGTLVMTGMLFATGLAHADQYTDTAKTEGASATCTMTSGTSISRNDTASISCDLTDTKGDAHPVYVEWWQDGFARKRLPNYDGVNHTSHHDDGKQNLDGGFINLYWRVCRDVQLGPDNCSDPISHKAGQGLMMIPQP